MIHAQVTFGLRENDFEAERSGTRRDTAARKGVKLTSMVHFKRLVIVLWFPCT